MDIDIELRKLIAERDITRFLYAYHDAINRGRFEELGELFELATYSTEYARTAEHHGTQQADGVMTNWTGDYRTMLEGPPRD